MAQSSVDWFFQQIRNNGGGFTAEELFEWHKQAKQMEKELIINAFGRHRFWMATDNELRRIAAEQYYNETYGNNTDEITRNGA